MMNGTLFLFSKHILEIFSRLNVMMKVFLLAKVVSLFVQCQLLKGSTNYLLIGISLSEDTSCVCITK